MSRLDRRQRDPAPGDLRNVIDADVANRTIVPNRPTGVFRTGKEDIALNRAYQAFGNQKTMQQFVNRYLNDGGVSPLYGANPKVGGSQPEIPTIPENTWIASYDAIPNLRLPTHVDGVYDFTVFWGDGSSDTITAWDDPKVTHTYGLAGQYYVVVIGQFEGIRFNPAEVNQPLEMLYFGTGVKLGNLITDYGYFENCRNLTTVNAASLDVSGEVQFYRCFSLCSSLTEIDVSSWDMTSAENLRSMFAQSGLVSIDLSSWVLTTAFATDELFSACASLTTANLSGLFTTINAPFVSDVSGFFNGCRLLTSLDITGWDTSSIKILDKTFRDCTVLADIDVSGWNWSNTSEAKLNELFSGCTSLSTTTIGYIEAWDVANVREVKFLFDATFVQSINLSGWDVSDMVEFEGMFSNCSQLILVNLSGWILAQGSNTTDMFNGCLFLPSINLNSWDTTELVSAGGMFSFCGRLTTLDIDQWTLTNLTNMVRFGLNVPITTASYDKILDSVTGWPSRIAGGNALVPFTMNEGLYTPGGTAEAGRTILEGAPYLWVITDAGPVVP